MSLRKKMEHLVYKKNVHMTRINLMSPSLLCDQHLLAEHREIKRIPNVIKSGRYSLEWMPTNYTLWTWHVKFFYNKLKWLKMRYILLHQECIKRNFNVTFYIESFDNLPKELYNEYTPTKEEIDISWGRILEKLLEKNTFYTHYLYKKQKNENLWNDKET